VNEEETLSEEVTSAAFMNIVDSSTDRLLYQIEGNVRTGHSSEVTTLGEEVQGMSDHRFFYWVSNAIIFVDESIDESVFGSEFTPEYEQVIDELRNGSREVLADEVVEILRNNKEDPEEPEIKIFSLQAMARFLVSHKEFEDPIIGPDPSGLVQIEWHIDGNGLLVMAFLDNEKIHCIAQADETTNSLALNESAIMTEEQALKELGHLVPTC
jgi:hypothetical protein